jgi:hypothetical protein
VFVVVHTDSEIKALDTLEGLCQTGFEIYPGLFQAEYRIGFLAMLFFLARAFLSLFLVMCMTMSGQTVVRFVSRDGKTDKPTLAYP